MTITTEVIGNERYYKIGGKRYISVTSIFNILEKPGLSEWRKRVGEAEANRITAEASNFGTTVHNLCEKIAKGADITELEFPSEEIKTQVMRFNAWMQLMVEEVIGVEEKVYSDELGVAGQLDLLVRLKGDSCYTLADIKTGTVKPLMALQLAGYRRLIADCTTIPIEQIERRIIIPLKRGTKGPLKIKEFPPESNDFDLEVFESLVKVWRWLKRKGAR